MSNNNNRNGARKATAPGGADWQAEAKFWQLKYFEQLLHSTQVIAALSRPQIVEVQRQQQAAAAQAAAAETVAGQ